MKTIININLNRKNDFYNTYSNRQITNELKEFIYNECLGENYKNHITINIHTKLQLTEDEKENMMDAIRRTFGLRVQDELYYYEENQKKKTIMLLIGILLIILYYSPLVGVLKEIILILGWLDIWESVYSLIFDSRAKQVYIIRLRELAKARVYFLDE